MRIARIHGAGLLAGVRRFRARDDHVLVEAGTARPARASFSLPVRILQNKYGMDALWIDGFAGGAWASAVASRVVDEKVIDGAFVNGSVRFVGWFAGVLRRTQSGYLYHYAFAMILGLIAMLAVLMRYWQCLVRRHEHRLEMRREPDSVHMPFRLLSLLVWLPILGGVAGAAARRRAPAAGALGCAGRALVALCRRAAAAPASTWARAAMQFVEQPPWIPAFTSTTTSASTASRCR